MNSSGLACSKTGSTPFGTTNIFSRGMPKKRVSCSASLSELGIKRSEACIMLLRMDGKNGKKLLAMCLPTEASRALGSVYVSQADFQLYQQIVESTVFTP